MKLYAKPDTIELPDGSLQINVSAITPKYIDKQIRILSVFSRICEDDFEAMIADIRKSASTEEAIANICNHFKLTKEQGKGIVNMTLDDIMQYGNKEKSETEIAWLKKLKKLLSEQGNQ